VNRVGVSDEFAVSAGMIALVVVSDGCGGDRGRRGCHPRPTRLDLADRGIEQAPRLHDERMIERLAEQRRL
jgi:hypothetical protein